MKRSAPVLATWCVLLALGAVAAGPVQATADLVVDRGLPIYDSTTPNLNAGGARSNISWGGYTIVDESWISGDIFAMPDLPAGQQWTIDTIRIWSPAIPRDGGGTLGDFYSSITLYADLYSELGNTALSLRSTGSISGNVSGNNPNIKFTRVSYQGASGDDVDYLGQDANWYQLWQVDFTNLGWVVPPSEWIQFGVDAAANTQLPWVNHASNAEFSNNPTQQDADGYFTYISMLNALGNSYDCESGTDPECVWTKPSDINVQVFATPAPGSLALALIGLLGLSAARPLWSGRHRRSCTQVP